MTLRNKFENGSQVSSTEQFFRPSAFMAMRQRSIASKIADLKVGPFSDGVKTEGIVNPGKVELIQTRRKGLQKITTIEVGQDEMGFLPPCISATREVLIDGQVDSTETYYPSYGHDNGLSLFNIKKVIRTIHRIQQMPESS